MPTPRVLPISPRCSHCTVILSEQPQRESAVHWSKACSSVWHARMGCGHRQHGLSGTAKGCQHRQRAPFSCQSLRGWIWGILDPPSGLALQRLHLACSSGAQAASRHRPAPSVPQKPLQRARPWRSSLPAGVHPWAASRRQHHRASPASPTRWRLADRLPQLARSFNSRCLTSRWTFAGSPPQLREAQPDAAGIKWCVKTSRPAAPEGCGSSSAGRAPKQRPSGRAGRGRERRAHESALRRLVRLR